MPGGVEREKKGEERGEREKKGIGARRMASIPPAFPVFDRKKKEERDGEKRGTTTEKKGRRNSLFSTSREWGRKGGEKRGKGKEGGGKGSLHLTFYNFISISIPSARGERRGGEGACRKRGEKGEG